MGISHFEKLETEVSALRIIDRESADDPQWESAIENADLIYFSGGDPNYLHETMNGSRAWSAAQRAWERGAVYAGCSAGAMILAKRIPSFRLFGTVVGFGIVSAQFILPHFDAIPVMFKPLIAALKAQIKKGDRMLGIDEETALVGRLNGEWKVMGRGKVHVIANEGNKTYQNGQTLLLD
jgi:cyanophycinase